MGKSLTGQINLKDEMKKYVVISGFDIKDNNRGTAALSYGAISFLEEKGMLKQTQELLNIKVSKRIWKYRSFRESILFNGKSWNRNVIYVSFIEKFIFDNFGLLFYWTKFGRSLRNIDLVANINGGDGFSDIYNTKTFLSRLLDTWIAIKLDIPFIFLPQTIGPFKEKSNFDKAISIIKKAKTIYVRDDKFVDQLEKLQVKYELTKDLSAYMYPEPFDIKLESDSIGINISGLAYFNRFRTLAGKFNSYPQLINAIISYFQEIKKTIYLIPHSYNYNNAEDNNDDLLACRSVYNGLINKDNVIVVDKDLTSPQIKYIISRMSFFIGTRMHANFAAIYTGVPVFGLAYSYKFVGAFENNGLTADQIYMITDLQEQKIDDVVSKIKTFYLTK